MATTPEDHVPTPTGKVGYESLRECHKKAYAYLTEALKIDENASGGSMLQYYSITMSSGSAQGWVVEEVGFNSQPVPLALLKTKMN